MKNTFLLLLFVSIALSGKAQSDDDILFSSFTDTDKITFEKPTYIAYSDQGRIYPVTKICQINGGKNGCVTLDTEQMRYVWNNNDEKNNSIIRIKTPKWEHIFRGRVEGEPIRHPNDSEIYDGKLYVCDTGMSDGSTSPEVKVIDIDADTPKLLETIALPYNETYRTGVVSIDTDGIAYICQLQAIPVKQRTHIQVVALDLKQDRTATDYTPEGAVIASFQVPTHRYYVQGSTLVGHFLFVTINSGGENSDIIKIDLKKQKIVETITLAGMKETEGMLHYFRDGKLILELQDVKGSLFRIVY